MKSKNEINDIFFTFLNSVWRLVSGPIMMLLIPFFLSKSEQGYWYLFISLSALTALGDLGFSNIVLQFASHEFAFLQFDSTNTITGEEYHLVRLGSLFRFTIKWVGSIGLIILPIIFIIGYWFLYRDNMLCDYLLPWVIYSIGTLINFLNLAILSFLEGLNKISVIQKIRLFVAFLNTTLIALFLIGRLGLYALAFSTLCSALSINLIVKISFGKIINFLVDKSSINQFNWKNEILPLFAKYSLSFASGYFIFQIYTPLMQYFHGPIESGRVGLTYTLVTAIFTFSNIWIYTITPQMNIFVSKKEFKILNVVFKKRLYLSIITYLCISLILFILYTVFHNIWFFPKLFDRFLPINSIVILTFCYLFQLIINAFATYLRAYKKEPYMVPSIFLAFWILLSTVLVGNYLAPEYLFLGLLSSYLWWMPLAFIIYRKCQRSWNV